MDNGIKQCYPNVMTATYDEVVYPTIHCVWCLCATYRI